MDTLLKRGNKIPIENTKVKRLYDKNNESRHHSTRYGWFGTMADALNFSQNHGHLPIFTVDKENAKREGSRRFLVASYQSFLSIYEAVTPPKRCYYEVILENIPCHIHVDMEYSKVANPLLESEKVVSVFMYELFTFLVKYASAPEDSMEVSHMDSSNEKKFSAHFVIKIRDCSFLNNFHVGALMRCFQLYTFRSGHRRDTSVLWAWSRSESDYEDPNKKEFVADMAIYTMRRQFRLCYSTKMGQNRYLYPSNLIVGAEENVQVDRDTVMKSLIQCAEPTKFLFEWTNPDGSLAASASHKHRHLMEFAPGAVQYRDRANPTGGAPGSSWQPRPASFTRKPSQTLRGASLPPVAVAIVKMIEREYSTEAYEPCLFLDSMTLRVPVYDKNCDIAGRIHQGNHVKYIVYLKKGFYKKGCQDPDCSSKFAWQRDLPTDLKDMAKWYTLEEAVETLDMKLFWGEVEKQNSF